MTLTVLIPWRPQPSRLDAFDAVAGWYRRHVGDVGIRPIDSDDNPFNLARCRNLCIYSVADPDRVVVINDADTLPQLGPLLEAVEAAATSGLVHLPYTEYRWLGAAGTAQFFTGAGLESCEFDLVRGACSGVYVTTAATWRSHGGQDERFRGWGFEDAAWRVAHESLLGLPPQRHPGAVFALHHAAQPREGPHYDANSALMDRYREASASRERMSQFVFGDSMAEADSMAENARSRPGS